MGSPDFTRDVEPFLAAWRSVVVPQSNIVVMVGFLNHIGFERDMTGCITDKTEGVSSSRLKKGGRTKKAIDWVHFPGSCIR